MRGEKAGAWPASERPVQMVIFYFKLTKEVKENN